MEMTKWKIPQHDLHLMAVEKVKKEGNHIPKTSNDRMNALLFACLVMIEWIYVKVHASNTTYRDE